MVSNSVAVQGRQQATCLSDGLKAFLLTWLTAAVLSLGIGATVAGAAAAILGVTAGGLGIAYESCQRVEANLAADLGLSATMLRGTDPATLPDRVVAQQAAGALNLIAANRANDRIAAYSGCRQSLLAPNSVR